MKPIRRALLPLVAFALTGLYFPAQGWFSPRSAAGRPELRSAKSSDLTSEAGLRHRRGQNLHWRSLILHR